MVLRGDHYKQVPLYCSEEGIRPSQLLHLIWVCEWVVLYLTVPVNCMTWLANNWKLLKKTVNCYLVWWSTWRVIIAKYRITSECTVLYCTVLYCTVLYCTVLYCTVLYCTVLYCTVLYCTVLYCTGCILHQPLPLEGILTNVTISRLWALASVFCYISHCQHSYCFTVGPTFI